MSRDVRREPFVCTECGKQGEQLASCIRRAKKRGWKLFCSRKCAAAQRRFGRNGPVIQTIGMTFGMLTVTDDLGVVDRQHRVVVSCACGTSGKIIRFKLLKNNESKSCGCQMNSEAHLAASSARLLAWVKAQPKITLDDLLARSIPIPFSGCWVYPTKSDTKYTYAHRLAYTLAHGSVPEGLELDHLCRVPRCINPDHLEPVTPSENQRRRFEDIKNPSKIRVKSQCIPL
jgi:HNH endonuclease